MDDGIEGHSELDPHAGRLGTLPQEDQERIEERYFADDGFYQEMLDTADEVIHAYLVGVLAEEYRRRFATHFLASRFQRQRLELS